jgi:tryptophanyl-tRNA synthetase
MQRVLSGIRATGRLHLGNYLGAVKGMVELQERSDVETFFMVADLHSITTPFKPHDLADNRREVIIDYLAAGLDPEKSVLFLQSMVDEHAALAFYFSCVVSIARMQHLPTFKEKVKQYPDNATMALLNYPVLMASDILLYKANLVPVGIDQEPHLEITREIARKMNDTFGLSLPEPMRFATSGEYVPSLKGDGKMSKTVEGSYISLVDDLNTIKKRLAGAETDSGKGSLSIQQKEYAGKQVEQRIYTDQSGTVSGVGNVLTFVELFLGKPAREAYEQQYESTGIRYGELKELLAEAIFKQLEPLQARRAELVADGQYVDSVIEAGAAKARAVARQTLDEVKQSMGLG